MNYSHDTELDLIASGYDGKYIPVVVFVATNIVVGLFGNTCATVFYGWKARKSVIQVFVLSLCLNDLLSNVIFLADIVDLLHQVEAYRSSAICKLIYVLKHFVVANSLLFMLVISAERYHRVNFPFSRHITHRMAWWIIIGLLLFSFLIAIPASAIAGVVIINVTIESNDTVNGYHCMLSEERILVFGKSEFHIMDICIHAVILCSLVVFYSLIVRTIFITRKRVNSQGNVNISYRRKGSHTSTIIRTSVDVVEIPMKGDVSATHDCPERPKSVEQGRDIGVDNPEHQSSNKVNDVTHARDAETINNKRIISREYKPTLIKKLSVTLETNRTELRITTMTAAVTVLSLICFVPYYIEMSDTSSSDLNGEWPVIEIRDAIARRTFMLNSAIHPFILVAFHTEFRQWLVAYICHKVCSICSTSNV